MSGEDDKYTRLPVLNIGGEGAVHETMGKREEEIEMSDWVNTEKGGV